MLRAEVQSSRLREFPFAALCVLYAFAVGARRANACSVMYRLTNPCDIR